MEPEGTFGDSGIWPLVRPTGRVVGESGIVKRSRWASCWVENEKVWGATSSVEMGEHFGESGISKTSSGSMGADRGLLGILKESSGGEKDLRSSGSLGLSGIENRF